MVADTRLAELRAEVVARRPIAPAFADVIEDAGRQRLAAYYLYSALISGLIGDGDLAPARWPVALSHRMDQFGLTRLAPRTERGLDAELEPVEQSTRRSAGREFEFAKLAADLINEGVGGIVLGEPGHVKVADPTGAGSLELEVVAGTEVIDRVKARDYWELVAQRLAGAPASAEAPDDSHSALHSRVERARRLKESGISHAVSVSTGLAVHVHPLGAAAGVGTRLVRARIQTGREQADAFRRLGEKLRALRAQAYGELRRRSTRSAA